jgi:putative transposase
MNMSRYARKRSDTGIFHLMLRGINHQNIFEDEEDLENRANISDNKKNKQQHVYRYNRKYKRCGYLFQKRIKNEAVENNAYLLIVLRYIHKNPVKAGLVQVVQRVR